MSGWDGRGVAPTTAPALTVDAGSQTRARLVATIAVAVVGVALVGLVGLASVVPVLAAVSWSSASSADTPSGRSADWSSSALSPGESLVPSSTWGSRSSSSAGARQPLGIGRSSWNVSGSLILPGVAPQADGDPTASTGTDVPPPTDPPVTDPPPTDPAPTDPAPTPTPSSTDSTDSAPITGDETRQFYMATVLALGLIVCLAAVHTVSSWGRSE